MFTGLIRANGSAYFLSAGDGCWELVVLVRCDAFASRVKEGDSIAVDGVCLTLLAVPEGVMAPRAVALPEDGSDCECTDSHDTNLLYKYRFFVMEETRSRTTFGHPPACEWSEDKPGRVNVERSLRFGDELGGHLVLGHAHGVCEVCEVGLRADGSRDVWVRLPADTSRDAVHFKGSIALHGVSLTVASLREGEGGRLEARVSLIPATMWRTNLGALTGRAGAVLNFELDSAVVGGWQGGWGQAAPSAAQPGAEAPDGAPTLRGEDQPWARLIDGEDATVPERATREAPATDEEHMMHALRLSERFSGVTAPNPHVGCVITDPATGRVLGQGAHRAAGTAHAERAAVEDARRWGNAAALRGATVYSTLEPCANWGHTPPCDRLLASVGVARVVVAVTDPDRTTAGRGIARLRGAGIRVDVGTGSAEVSRSLRAYLHHRATGLPWVVAKVALSVDGCVATAGGSSQWITGADARRHAHRLRAASQAVLVGSGTAIADNPSLTVREANADEEVGTMERQPLRVVLDATGQLLGKRGREKAPNLYDAALAPTLVLTTPSATSQHGGPGGSGGSEVDGSGSGGGDEVEVAAVPVAGGGRGGVDLPSALRLLGSRGVLQVLVEGGAALHSSLLREGLVDELCLYRGNALIGNGLSWPQGLASPDAIHDAPRLTLLETLQWQDGTFERWLFPRRSTGEAEGHSAEDEEWLRVEGARTASLASLLPHATNEAPAGGRHDNRTGGGEEGETFSFTPVEEAVARFGRGEILVVMDDASRENEGDLIQAAQFATGQSVAQIVQATTGLVCSPMLADRAAALGLQRQVPQTAATDPLGTAWMVGVDAAECSTGASAEERAMTLRALASAEPQARLLRRPGHVFPLLANGSGLSARRGHTEASVTLCRLAGVRPVAVLAELVEEDGSMRRLPSCAAYAREHDLAITSVEDLHGYALGAGRVALLPQSPAAAPSVGVTPPLVAETTLSLKDGPWALRVYAEGGSDAVAAASAGEVWRVLVKGDAQGAAPDEEPPLVRVHSDCWTSEVVGSAHCDCAQQLRAALVKIAERGVGAVVFPPRHEGRGIGFAEKVKAYALMRGDSSLDTYQANTALGHAEDARDYGASLAILRANGFNRVVLLTTNPDKVAALRPIVAEARSLRVEAHAMARAYMRVKEARHAKARNCDLARVAHDRANVSGEDEHSQPADRGGGEVVAGIRVMPKALLANVQGLPSPDDPRVRSLSVHILAASWHPELIDQAVEDIESHLASLGVSGDNVAVTRVAGSYELAYAAQKKAAAPPEARPRVIVTLGILIKGETMHFEYVGDALAQGLMRVQLDHGVPIVNGCLHVLNKAQAAHRYARGGKHNSAHGLAMTAVHQALLE